MRAAIWKGKEQLTVTSCDKPQIKKGEILLKIVACGICGTDLKIYQYGHRIIQPPRILGHEIVGIVEQNNSSKKILKIGTPVIVVTPVGCMKCAYCKKGKQNMCPQVTDKAKSIGYYTDGGFAEYIRIPKEAVDQDVLIPIPKTTQPLAHFTLCEPLSCVINGQEKLHISSEDTVLILGAGPIGCLHACLARSSGAKKIILCDISKEKLDLAKHMPADLFVHHQNGALEDIIKKETAAGADVVIVAAPSGEGQEDAVRFAAPMGRISFFGGLPPSHPRIALDSNRVHYKELELYGAFASARTQYVEAMNLILNKKIDANMFMTHTLSLENILDAFTLMKQHQAIKINICPSSK